MTIFFMFKTNTLIQVLITSCLIPHISLFFFLLPHLLQSVPHKTEWPFNVMLSYMSSDHHRGANVGFYTEQWYGKHEV